MSFFLSVQDKRRRKTVFVYKMSALLYKEVAAAGLVRFQNGESRPKKEKRKKTNRA